MKTKRRDNEETKEAKKGEKAEFEEILYLYDISAKNKKEFNRTKRRFYYWLNQMFPKKEAWKTKSVILVPSKYEKQMDGFFRSFKGKIKTFKAIVQSIEELE